MPPVRDELGERPEVPARRERAVSQPPPRTRAASILALQRSAGNHATAAALSRERRAVLQRFVGKVDDPATARSDTVHWYDWNGAAFAQSARTLDKGTTLKEARKTVQDDKLAFVTTEGGDTGFVRTKNLSIKHWGPLYDASKEWVDPHRLMATVPGNKGDVAGYQALHEEWYLDQAVLMDAYRDLKQRLATARPDDDKLRKQLEDTQRRLALAMLQSFSKAAEHKQARADQPIAVQMSPLLQGGAYYRSSVTTDLVTHLREVAAASAGIPKEQLELLADPSFAEVLAREFPVYSARQPKPQGVAVKTVPTTIGKTADFKASLAALLDNLDAGLAPTHTFVLDVSGYYQAQNATPATLQAQVAQPLEAELLAAVGTYLSTRAAKRDDVVKQILERIQLVVITEHQGTPILLTPKLLEATAEEKAGMDDTEVAKDVDAKTRAHFRAQKSHDDKTITSAMVESGARLDPIAAKETLLKLKDPEEVLDTAKLIQVGLGTGGQKAPDTGKKGKKAKGLTVEEELVAKTKASMSLTKFLGASVFSTFRSLSQLTKMGDGQPPPPYLTFYPEATCKLLAGLSKAKGALGDVDESFEARGITPVLDAAYMRMLGAMARAISDAGEIVPFLNDIEIIHDQLQLILGIVEPYEQDKAFAAGIVKALREPPEGLKRPTVPKTLHPEVHHKASSMHSLASIVSSMEEQKAGGPDKTRQLSTLVLKDNYYESAGAAEHSKTHLVKVLDGYKLGKDALKAKHFEDGKKPSAPFDLFICDFHHNISVERGEYKREDVTYQVDQLFSSGLVADRFTVAIDCTVDFTRSKDIRGFLEHNKGRIDRGELNVVLYRSAQKFDMLGMDNYYGGYTVTINDGRSYQAFNDRISRADDQVEGLAHQGMAHLAQFGTESQDEYRRALMKNTALLHKKLLAKGLGEAGGAIRIGTTTDPNNVFFDIQFPGTEALEEEGTATAGDHFFAKFMSWSRKVAKTAVTNRPSFGFATTNLTEIAGAKVRLNPGLEDESALDRYADYFADTKALLTPARQKARDEINRRQLAGEPLGKPTDTPAVALARAIVLEYEIAYHGGASGLATGAVAGRALGELDPEAIKKAGKMPAPSGAQAANVVAEAAPPQAPLAVDARTQPNPYLWFRPNNAGGTNLQVADHRPGPAWNYVEQFCAVLAIYWLTGGHDANGLTFAGLETGRRDAAIKTLLSWGGQGGSAAQVDDARKALDGDVVPADKARRGFRKGTYAEGTKVWFGNARHAEAAVLGNGGKWRVYDPNLGTTRELDGPGLSAYTASRQAIVIGLPG